MPSQYRKQLTIELVKGFWPEAGAALGFIFLLTLINLQLIPSLVLTAALYAGLRWAHHMSTRSATPEINTPTIDGMMNELRTLSHNYKLKQFEMDIARFVSIVNAAQADNDPGIITMAIETTDTVLGVTRDISNLKSPLPPQNEAARRYKSLLNESIENIQQCIRSSQDKDTAALAEQIDLSSKRIKAIQQDIVNGGL